MMRSVKLGGLALLVVLSAVPARGQKIEEIAFFKEAVGKWKGEGQSVVGPQKAALKVIDEWEGRLIATGPAETPVHVFQQIGKVTLSNGRSFTYTWLFGATKGELMASYRDSQNATGNYLFTVSKDQKTVTLTPVGLKKEPLKHGLFSIAKAADGKFDYDAEVRDSTGKPVIITKVACVKVKAPAEK